MRPATAALKPQVKFYEATPKTENSPAHLSGPPSDTVQQLGLDKKSTARIGFEGRGTVIYAKTWAEPKRAQRLWEKAHGRYKNRKTSARVVVDRLEKDVANSRGASRSPLVKSKLEEVRAQILERDSVAAKDLHALLDAMSKAEEAQAEQQLKFNAHIKGAATKLATRSAEILIRNLMAKKNVSPRFTGESIAGFLDFIERTAALDLNQLGTSPIAYKEVEKALEFAEIWNHATPKQALGSPNDRYLIDHLVTLIRGGDMVLDCPAMQGLAPFKVIDEKTLKGPGGNYVRDDEPLGRGGNAVAYLYRCGDYAVVGKSSIDNDARAAEKVRKEAQVHAQATMGDHRHVVDLLGIVENSKTGPMLVLQYAPHGDAMEALLKLLRRGRDQAAAATLMSMFVGMVEGAKAAHENGVMHLDLKPENYIIDEDGAPLLCDFGTSKGSLAQTMKSPTDSPDFSAPELVNGLKVPGTISFKADIWSLGVILYQFNSPRFTDGALIDNPGRLLPFPYEPPESVAAVKLINEFVAKDKAGRFQQLGLQMDNPLHQLIIQMLDPDPSNRPSLTTVLKHPSIAPYVNQSHEALIAARQLILEPPGSQLIEA
ncbi:hypothetical protein GCM10023165_33690 [Variovorax defluvii]|uniref:Protein kinase domain-containing protein n=1 Tax=Variovorax defluvii TaxID=913761 RepID=A0ABP8HZN1_9BURK